MQDIFKNSKSFLSGLISALLAWGIQVIILMQLVLGPVGAILLSLCMIPGVVWIVQKYIYKERNLILYLMGPIGVYLVNLYGLIYLISESFMYS